eukprot:scaffold11371_cov33-Prasinocladus_malaysianus.AAC.1
MNVVTMKHIRIVTYNDMLRCGASVIMATASTRGIRRLLLCQLSTLVSRKRPSTDQNIDIKQPWLANIANTRKTLAGAQ